MTAWHEVTTAAGSVLSRRTRDASEIAPEAVASIQLPRPDADPRDLLIVGDAESCLAAAYFGPETA